MGSACCYWERYRTPQNATARYRTPQNATERYSTLEQPPGPSFGPLVLTHFVGARVVRGPRGQTIGLPAAAPRRPPERKVSVHDSSTYKKISQAGEVDLGSRGAGGHLQSQGHGGGNSVQPEVEVLFGPALAIIRAGWITATLLEMVTPPGSKKVEVLFGPALAIMKKHVISLDGQR